MSLSHVQTEYLKQLEQNVLNLFETARDMGSVPHMEISMMLYRTLHAELERRENGGS